LSHSYEDARMGAAGTNRIIQGAIGSFPCAHHDGRDLARWVLSHRVDGCESASKGVGNFLGHCKALEAIEMLGFSPGHANAIGMTSHWKAQHPIPLRKYHSIFPEVARENIM
jgi:hypothetical protein